MTPPPIDELKAMLAKATPGPVYLGTAVTRGDGLSIALDRAPSGVEANAFLPMESFAVIGGRRARQDAELIAALISAAPSLLAAAERGARIEKAAREVYDAEADWQGLAGVCIPRPEDAASVRRRKAWLALDAALSAEGSDEG